eukprot:TRINITY_DN93846_c0_g1_i1.p1 TRINITY_DN93846_c0_g1~~TRINITY_DN93846_c0_g1_i1.p1  ORF type:complete len:344 (-),score=50.74 TRINITY_DN93846_c0_g1_i1:54-1085(-)
MTASALHVAAHSRDMHGKTSKAPPQRCKQEAILKYENLMFVDIDGVLNVGVKDGDSHPLSLSARNLEIAKYFPVLQGEEAKLESAQKGQAAARRLRFVSQCNLAAYGESNETTFEKFLSGDDVDVADEFVHRLASIIKAAGSKTLVVLTSTWRQPRYADKVRSLEMLLSKHMGKPFEFGARTSLEEVHSAAGRLAGMAQYLRQYCANLSPDCKTLRVLALEDFHITAMGWQCDGNDIRSVQDAEMYLRKSIPANLKASVKLLHTYAEWSVTDLPLVQVGSGITMQHFCNALEFFRPELVSQEGTPYVHPATKPWTTGTLSQCDDDPDVDAFPETTFARLTTVA